MILAFGHPNVDNVHRAKFAIATRWGIPVLLNIGRWEFSANREPRTWPAHWGIEPVAGGYMLALGRLNLFACRAPKRETVKDDQLGADT